MRWVGKCPRCGVRSGGYVCSYCTTDTYDEELGAPTHDTVAKRRKKNAETDPEESTAYPVPGVEW